MKHCKYCDSNLDESMFPKRSASADGLGYKCRECSSLYGKSRYASSEESRNAAKDRAATWHAENAERSRQIKAKSKAKKLSIDPDYENRRARELRVRSPDRFRAAGRIAIRKRKERVALRSVAWDADLTDLVLREARLLCGSREASTGIGWSIDHVIPIAGESVSGLHVWNNISVVPSKYNASKSHRHIGGLGGSDWIFFNPSTKNFGRHVGGIDVLSLD